MRVAAAGVLSCALLLPAPLAAQDEMEGLADDAPLEQQSDTPAPVEDGPVVAAVLQGLDKITARVSTFDAPIDQAVSFGTLEIVTRTCYKTPPEEPPERAAFLEIVDVRPDEPSVPLYTGWMFASSPALAALEHPVYDVWVIDCRKASVSSEETEAGN